jgi:hypothetical protein
MGMQKVLLAKQLEKVTRTGSVKITDKLIPNRPDPYFEQAQRQMQRGETIISISESEDKEDFYRRDTPAIEQNQFHRQIGAKPINLEKRNTNPI